MKPAVIWVTGARGFIGRHVSHHCANNGAYVAGLGHGAWSSDEAQSWGIAHWLNGDISNSNLTRLADAAGLPDVVIHLAGGSTVGAAIDLPREDFFRTVAATVEMLDWVRQTSPATKIVAVSSAAVYGAGHQGPISEDACLSPFSPYGHHKMMMESLCRSYGNTYGLPIVVARLFSVFGSELKKQLLWDICTRLDKDATKLVMGGSGNELRDWTDVRDVSRALVSLMAFANKDVPTYNVGTGRALTVRDIATMLVQEWMRLKNIDQPISLEFSGNSRPGDPFSLIANASRLQSLGFQWEIPAEQGLEDYVRWFQSHAARG